ncbi:MAG TPA: SRPBCC domain-containing protein [Aggregatilineales bacterium]|nr:SRPBCC domain-containing protein [Aggregatilineales bacterium]
MNSTLALERSIVTAADGDRVWRAITRPQHFSRWFGGDIRFERLAVGEPMTFHVGGQTGPATIAIVEPPERFAFHWAAEPGDPARTLVTFRLETVADGTRVTVTEEGFEALAERARRRRFELNDEGWSIQMANLAAYLRKGEDV